MVPMDVLGIQLAADEATPVVLLRETVLPHRIVPVVVGSNEALAIAMGLEGVSPPRPLTHDLLIEVLAQTDTTVGGVPITELRHGTFVAEMALAGPFGDRVVDSRPSDAIAIAVRVHAPLFVAEAVLEAAGVLPEADEPALDGGPDGAAAGGVGLDPADLDELVGEFRLFLDELSPADFAPADVAPADDGRSEDPSVPSADPGDPDAREDLVDPEGSQEPGELGGPGKLGGPGGPGGPGDAGAVADLTDPED